VVEQAVVQRALDASGIPAEKQGRRRAQRLSSGEQALYGWILEMFAAGTPPQPGGLAEAATRFEIEIDPALAALAREDLVHCDPATGTILVAYPFSGRPTEHRVCIDGREEVFAMCAIDALGIAPMLEQPIEIVSRDPVDGSDVWVRLDPGDGAWWEPTDALVLAGRVCDGPSLSSCCQVLNFFGSTKTAERYLHEHPTVSALPITILEATELGRIIFGDILSRD
jgi:hypothetical protein